MPAKDDADEALGDLRRQLVQFVLDEAGRSIADDPKSPLSTALLDAVDQRVAARVKAMPPPDAGDVAEAILRDVKPELLAAVAGASQTGADLPRSRGRGRVAADAESQGQHPGMGGRFAAAARRLSQLDYILIAVVTVLVLALGVGIGWAARAPAPAAPYVDDSSQPVDPAGLAAATVSEIPTETPIDVSDAEKSPATAAPAPAAARPTARPPARQPARPTRQPATRSPAAPQPAPAQPAPTPAPVDSPPPAPVGSPGL